MFPQGFTSSTLGYGDTDPSGLAFDYFLFNLFLGCEAPSSLCIGSLTLFFRDMQDCDSSTNGSECVIPRYGVFQCPLLFALGPNGVKFTSEFRWLRNNLLLRPRRGRIHRSPRRQPGVCNVPTDCALKGRVNNHQSHKYRSL